jgi:hypothetical protein
VCVRVCVTVSYPVCFINVVSCACVCVCVCVCVMASNCDGAHAIAPCAFTPVVSCMCVGVWVCALCIRQSHCREHLLQSGKVAQDKAIAEHICSIQKSSSSQERSKLRPFSSSRAQQMHLHAHTRGLLVCVRVFVRVHPFQHKA